MCIKILFEEKYSRIEVLLQPQYICCYFSDLVIISSSAERVLINRWSPLWASYYCHSQAVNACLEMLVSVQETIFNIHLILLSTWLSSHYFLGFQSFELSASGWYTRIKYIIIVDSILGLVYIYTLYIILVLLLVSFSFLILILAHTYIPLEQNELRR